MASKKQVSLDRQPQPQIEDLDDTSGSFRADVCSMYDEQNKEAVHSWQTPDPSERTLRMKGQEVVKDEHGEPIRDGMGDILVRQSREKFEKRQKMESDLSLTGVAASIGSMSEDEGLVEVDADLVQFAQAKQKKKPVTSVKIQTG